MLQRVAWPSMSISESDIFTKSRILLKVTGAEGDRGDSKRMT